MNLRPGELYQQHFWSVLRQKFWHYFKLPFLIWAPIITFVAWYNADPYDNLFIPYLVVCFLYLIGVPLYWALRDVDSLAGRLASLQYWEELSPAHKVRDYEKREWWLTWNERQDLKRLKQQLADELVATQKQPE